MEKPITVARKEFAEKLAVLLTEARELPAFVIGDILEDVLRQVRMIDAEQTKRDTEAYAKALNEKEAEHGKAES